MFLAGFKRLQQIITVVILQYRRRLRYPNYRSSPVYTAYVTAVLVDVRNRGWSDLESSETNAG